jgi:hypothetical protein
MSGKKDNEGYIWRGELSAGDRMTESWDPFAESTTVKDLDSLVPDNDPRAVATREAVTHARSKDRVLEPGVLSGHAMRPGQEYHV